tara:strand:- start:550 stop:792 length:243 start_codon:yes stop_codon:yes gene_type:complete
MSNIDEFISYNVKDKAVLINLIIARYNEGVRDGLITGVKNKTKDDNSFYNRGFDFGIEMTKEIEADSKSMSELIQALNKQ